VCFLDWYCVLQGISVRLVEQVAYTLDVLDRLPSVAYYVDSTDNSPRGDSSPVCNGRVGKS
jgi:hypothetical protein